ncbi:MAG: rhomboid family intramembrane serine protease [Spirochaetales bacterium]|nr:rhomboid family intramembrane serine protease [Spirochaetales bacterium]
MFKEPRGLRKPYPYRNLNISFILIALNVFVYFINMVIPRSAAYLALNPGTFLHYHFYWTPVTYMFTHGGMNHIIYNMLGLFFFGPQLERRMGSWEFLSFYMVTGILSGVFSLAVYILWGQNIFLIGASGAIFGILLAYAVYYPNAVVYLFFVIPIRTRILVPLFAALELAQEIFSINGGIGHLTHLAGFGVAFLYFIIRLGINPITSFRDSGQSPWQ